MPYPQITILPDSEGDSEGDCNSNVSPHADTPPPLPPPWRHATSTGDPATLLSRLGTFLPQLCAANAQLEASIAAGRGTEQCIEHVGLDEEWYIEMNIGLGVLEEKRHDTQKGVKGKTKRAEGQEKGDQEVRGGKRRRRGVEGSVAGLSELRSPKAALGKMARFGIKEDVGVDVDAGGKIASTTTTVKNENPIADDYSALSAQSLPGGVVNTEQGDPSSPANRYRYRTESIIEGMEEVGEDEGEEEYQEEPEPESEPGSEPEPEPSPQIDHLQTVRTSKTPRAKRRRASAAEVETNNVMATLLNIDYLEQSSVSIVGKPGIEVVESDG